MNEKSTDHTKEDTKEALTGILAVGLMIGVMGALAFFTYQGKKANDSYWAEMSTRATTTAQLDVVGYLRSECQDASMGAKNTINDTKECAAEALRDLRVRATPIYVLDKDVKALGLDQ